MKALVVYDSWYHNTEKIAQLIGEAFGNNAEIINIKDRPHPDLENIDLLVVGSPTHGGVATPSMKEFLDSLEPGSLSGIPAAAFDTRVHVKWVKIIGFAAKRIAKSLHRAGASIISAEGFYVSEKEGPLAEGELQRAKSWAKSLAGTKV